MLRDALAYMPAGVHLAVVDPEVGAVGTDARRAVALRTAEEDRLLVGPDNGLLMLAAERLGGVLEAVDIGRSARAPASRSRPPSTDATSSRPSPPRSPRGEPLADVGEPLAGRGAAARWSFPAPAPSTARSSRTCCAPITSAT